jgi:uncharacterized protein YeaO (DUF488 family)
MKSLVRTKRIYEPASAEDGVRVLVDRVWPRGITKKDAKLDVWMRDIGPSTDLRKWFGHRPERWLEFKKRYAHELDRNTDLVAQLLALTGRGPVTLLYSARDIEHNNAEALREYLGSLAKG